MNEVFVSSLVWFLHIWVLCQARQDEFCHIVHLFVNPLWYMDNWFVYEYHRDCNCGRWILIKQIISVRIVFFQTEGNSRQINSDLKLCLITSYNEHIASSPSDWHTNIFTHACIHTHTHPDYEFYKCTALPTFTHGWIFMPSHIHTHTQHTQME